MLHCFNLLFGGGNELGEDRGFDFTGYVEVFNHFVTVVAEAFQHSLGFFSDLANGNHTFCTVGIHPEKFPKRITGMGVKNVTLSWLKVSK